MKKETEVRGTSQGIIRNEYENLKVYYNSNTKFKLLGMYIATEFGVVSPHNKADKREVYIETF